MFFESPETESRLRKAPNLRLAIFGCAIMTLLFGIGPMSELLLDMVTSAIDSMMGL